MSKVSGGQSAGVERDDAHVLRLPRRHVDDHHAFVLKAGNDRKAVTVRVDGPSDDLLGGGVFQMRSRAQTIS